MEAIEASSHQRLPQCVVLTTPLHARPRPHAGRTAAAPDIAALGSPGCVESPQTAGYLRV